jgi:hypothetical protein
MIGMIYIRDDLQLLPVVPNVVFSIESLLILEIPVDYDYDI